MQTILMNEYKYTETDENLSPYFTIEFEEYLIVMALRKRHNQGSKTGFFF